MVKPKHKIKTIQKNKLEKTKKDDNVTNILKFQKTEWKNIVYYEVGVSAFHQPEDESEYYT